MRASAGSGYEGASDAKEQEGVISTGCPLPGRTFTYWHVDPESALLAGPIRKLDEKVLLLKVLSDSELYEKKFS